MKRLIRTHMSMVKRLIYICCLAICFTLSITSLSLSSKERNKIEILLDNLASSPSPSESGLIRREVWSLWLEGYIDRRNKRQVDEALDLFNTGKLEKAKIAFSEIIELDPDYVEGWNKRATVKFLLGDFYGSLKDIEEVLKRQPRHFGAISGSGLILIHNSDFREAYKSYKRLTEIDPHNEDGKRFLPMLENKLYGKSL